MLAQNIEQPLFRAAVIRIVLQDGAIGALRLAELAAAAQHVGAEQLRGDAFFPFRLRQRRAERERLRAVAVFQRLLRRRQLRIEARVVGLLLPFGAALAAKLGRALQVVRRFAVAAAALRDVAHARQRVGVLRTGAQHFLKAVLRAADVAAVKRVKARALLGAADIFTVVIHYRRVLRMALLPALIARGVRRLRAEPQQRLAQRTIGLRAAVRQRAEQIHALAARRVLIGQGFAQRQSGADILRMRRRELAQRVDRLRQQGAVARHRQVVLRRHAGGRLVAVKGVAPRLQRRGNIAAARLLARQRQLRLRDGLQLARVIQLAQARVLRRDAA